MNPRARPLLLIAWLFAAASASGADVVIRNGLAPPDPANVLDASDDLATSSVIVRSVGCGDPDPFAPACATPGAATAVDLVDGGVIGQDLWSLDASETTMRGGSVAGSVHVHGTNVYDQGSFALRGGTIAGDLLANDGPVIRVSGGTIAGDFEARTTAFLVPNDAAFTGGSIGGVLRAIHGGTIYVWGRDFTVDGVPYPSTGVALPSSGLLAGTLASGEPFSVLFEATGGYIYPIRAPIVVANGLAPPDPANVLDASDDPDENWWIVRNVGCGMDDPIEHPCLAAGAPTAFELQAGRSNSVDLRVFDSSSLDVVGAVNGDLIYAYDAATLTIGSAVQDLYAVWLYDTANATVDGSQVGGVLAQGTSHISATDAEIGGLDVQDEATAVVTRGSVARLSLSGVSGTVEDATVGQATTGGSATLSLRGGTLGFLASVDDSHVSLDQVAVSQIFGARGASTLELVDCSVAQPFWVDQEADVHLTRVSADSLYSDGTSTVHFDSGTATGLVRARGHSAIELVDVSAEALQTEGDARIHILRGTAQGWFSASGNSVLDWDGAVGAAKPVQVISAAQFHLRAGSIWQLLGDDSSRFDLGGGDIDNALFVRGSAIASITGGSVGYDADADEQSTLLIKGGHIGRYLSARGSASVAIRGTNFAVDGVPIPYGPLPVPHGVLTGTLISGEPISNEFFHAGSQPPHLYGLATGTIRVPEPDAAGLAFAALLALGRVAATSREAR